MAHLLASRGGESGASARERAGQRVADAEARIRRHQAAIEAGVDPTALVEVINEAQAERAAARAALESLPDAPSVTRADVYAMIDSLGDVRSAITENKPTPLARLYEKLKLELRYEPQERAVFVTATPRVANECVRGGT
ncbi:hypothetical protein [Prauserella flavalba]|uniref:hypothetical protein n=1 Tax=Prauserella flavalba TaxID=1477506 RepID=UPI0036DFBD9C